MFDFLKKFTSDPSKKPSETSTPTPAVQSQPPERKPEEPRQLLNNGLSKQLFSDIRINRPTQSPNPSTIKPPQDQPPKPIQNERKFKIFEDSKGNKKEEEKAETYLNASVNFGRMKAENVDLREENFREGQMKEAFNKEAIASQLNKNIITNTKSALEERTGISGNVRKKIFEERPQKKLGDERDEEFRKNSEDLMAEKSLKILQSNQNAILSHEDPMNINEILKEIDAHYFNENSEDNLIHKELLRLPKNAKIDEVAARVEVLDRYSNMIAAKLSKNALKHYEKFGIFNWFSYWVK